MSRTPGLEIVRFGERALLVRAPDQASVHALAKELLEDLRAGLLEDVTPGDRTLLVQFDGTDAGETATRRALADADRRGESGRSVTRTRASRRRVIPVLYGGEEGPDLEATAALAGVSPDEVIERHTSRDYPVLFLGFAPGFPYCGDLPASLVVPRLETPRTTTRPGSVAVAEGYTGIYPAGLPGGWRIIGWTPVLLFDPTADPPTYLLPDDSVRFAAVDRADVPASPYRAWDWSDR